MTPDDLTQQRLKAIHRYCDGLNVTNWRPLAQGQNNDALLINDEWVFRFPKHKGALIDLRNEELLLREISGRLSFRIPAPRWQQLASGVGTAFLAHRLIRGSPFTPDRYHALSPAGRERVISEIGKFLTELHSLPVHGLEQAGVRRADSLEQWQRFREDVIQKLVLRVPGDARGKLEADLDETVIQLQDLKFIPSVRHGDFGPGNILFDEDTGRLTSVIDFSSAAIGDPATDIAGLISPVNFGIEFAASLCPHYPGLDQLINRAMLYTRTFALQEALLGVAGNEPEMIEQGLADYL